MNLDDKIKEAFRKDNLLREATKWSHNTQPNLYELDNFLRKAGYNLIDVLKEDEEVDTPELIIEPLKEGPLYPEISHDIKLNTFYVKVIKYGLLDSSDLGTVIQGYENALAVLEHLQSLDLSKLEV